MLSTFEAENRHLDKHTEPQLKKRCAYKKKMCMEALELSLKLLNFLCFNLQPRNIDDGF